MTGDDTPPGGEPAWRLVVKLLLFVAVPAALIYVVKVLVG